MDHKIICKCGKRDASFNFKNEIMPPETIETLYCPDCSGDADLDASRMIQDNGWVIHFDMDVAGLYGKRLPAHEAEKVSPELLFDEGYVTWRGVYPGDHIDSVHERQELAKLAKTDPKKYFQEMKSWAVTRMARLKDQGWRKADEQ
ncbi:MAG: hypothetical protein JSW20_10545 [Nitrospiraceae bacterium]|nr:MAG: hypothetical protein JSW20_10545 [Nitrospiraceae bacterium]